MLQLSLLKELGRTMSSVCVHKESLVVLAGLLQVALPSATSSQERKDRWRNLEECLRMACRSQIVADADKVILSQLAVLLSAATQTVNDLEDMVTLRFTVPCAQETLILNMSSHVEEIEDAYFDLSKLIPHVREAELVELPLFTRSLDLLEDDLADGCETPS